MVVTLLVFFGEIVLNHEVGDLNSVACNPMCDGSTFFWVSEGKILCPYEHFVFVLLYPIKACDVISIGGRLYSNRN